MKTKIGMIALAAAGVGFLLCTDKGRSVMRQANQLMHDGYDKINEYQASRTGVPKLIDKALEQPHPDTAMAHAFEEAVA